MSSKMSKTAITAEICFYSLLFVSSIIIPNILSAEVAISKTKTFCDDHKGLCDQDQIFDYYDDQDNLVSQVKSVAYMTAILGSLFGALIAFIFVMFTVYVPRSLCLKDQNENTPLLPNRRETFCGFFKNFKENVFPSKFAIYQLVMSTLSLVATGTFIAWLNASFCQSTICENIGETCYNFRSISDPHAQHELVALSKDVFISMFLTGIFLTTVSSLAGSLSALTLSAGARFYREMKKVKVMSHAESRRETRHAMIAPL